MFSQSEFWLHQPVAEALARLKAKGLAVDVGANCGEWAASMSQAFEAVIAVEPDKRASASIPTMANLRVVHGAVSDRDGEVTIYMRHTTGHNSLLAVHPIGGGGMAPVPVMEERVVPSYTLDSLLPDGCDFIKIDIEGGETLALQGCSDPAKWSRTVFLVECHDTFSDVERELSRLGKRVTRIPHPYYPAAHPGHCWAIAE
jgi:FkbM family methyltransferase